MIQTPDITSLAKPAAPNASALEDGRLLFTSACNFLTSAATSADIPPHTLPEVAFAGRSNVGKSSLLNALTGRRNLARTSQVPGRTRHINFFALEKRLMLADLPGYGFSRASKQEAHRWSSMTTSYLRGRANLRRCCLLIDARRGALDSDREMMALLNEAAVSFQVILTKSDKVKPVSAAHRTKVIDNELRSHAAAYPIVLLTSSISGNGVDVLRAILTTLARAT